MKKEMNINGYKIEPFANLRGANLYGTEGIFTISSIGSRKDTLVIYIFENELMFKTGCFNGTKTEFENAIKETHGITGYGAIYLKAIELAEIWFMEIEK